MKTTFILGAGSNRELGFPLGKEMYQNAINDILFDSNSVLYAVLAEFNEKNELGAKFMQFAKDLKQARLSSIDEFVIKHPIYQIIAKIVISYYLIEKENSKNVDDLTAGHWYNYIWENLYERDVANFPKSKISFITFNYDRSLEYFLYKTIATIYENDIKINKGKITLIDLINRIPIRHVYGRLGNLEIENENDKNFLAYGYEFVILPTEDVKEEKIKRLVPMIRKAINGFELILNNRNNSTERISEILDLINQSNQIVFLGFAFSKDNMKVLFPNQLKLDNNQFNSLGYLHDFKNDDLRELNRLNVLETKYGIKIQRDYPNILNYLKKEIDFLN